MVVSEEFEECAGAMQERRAGSIQPLVADDVYFTVSNCGNVSPSGDLIGLRGAGSCSGGGPGENDEIGIGRGDLRVGDFGAGGNAHFAAADGH